MLHARYCWLHMHIIILYIHLGKPMIVKSICKMMLPISTQQKKLISFHAPFSEKINFPNFPELQEKANFPVHFPALLRISSGKYPGNFGIREI